MEDEPCADVNVFDQWLHFLNRMTGRSHSSEVVGQLISRGEKRILHDALLDRMGSHLVD